MKTKKILMSLVMLMAVSLLLIQTGCKKDDNEPSVQGYAIIGNFPDTPFLNSLKSKISIVPLSSNVPIFINSDAVDGLTNDQKNDIVMAYRKGMPITMLKPDQLAANKLVELTGHELPIVFDTTMPERVVAISVALLPGQVLGYTVHDENTEGEDLDFSVTSYLGWLNETTTEGNQYQLKSLSEVTSNLSDEAKKFSNTQMIHGGGVTITLSGYVQVIYSCGDNNYYTFSNFTLQANPVVGNPISVEANSIGINGSNISSLELHQPQPETTTSATSITNDVGHSFSAGVSCSFTGVSVSFTATASYSNSVTHTVPATNIRNDSQLYTGDVNIMFSWNQNPGYASYPINWYWEFPYDESYGGQTATIGGTLSYIYTSDDGGGGETVLSEIPFSQYPFTIPKKKCSDW